MIEASRKDKILKEITEILNENKLDNKALVDIYSSLGISIGCSIEGYKEIPDINELEKSYYIDPKMGQALILQSILLAEWTKK